MALVSSIGVGDSASQLLRLGFGGWVFAAIFATILRQTKADLNAAEALAIGAPAGTFLGTKCTRQKCVLSSGGASSHAPVS